MRSWGVFHRADVTQWLRGHGFVVVQPGNHISARAQEFLFEEACRNDARVALFEAVFVRRCTWAARWPFLTEPLSSRAHSNGSPSWEQLDSVDLSQSVCFDGCPC